MNASQRAILDALRELAGPFGPPSCREIAAKVGARSHAGVWMNLQRLYVAGLVDKRGGKFVAKET